MEHCKEKNLLADVNGLANILARESDSTKAIMPVLDYVKKLLSAEKICAVVFFPGGGAEVFCNKGASCGECGEVDAIKDFAKRITAVSTHPLSGKELTTVLEEEEKKRFKFKNPLFFPICAEGRIFGALWCDGDTEVWEEDILFALSPLIGMAFRHAFYYESQLGQEKTLLRILDNLDASIYVSDLDTDEILFINKKMLKEFDITRDVTGEKCWKVLQEGMKGRCPFCPSNSIVIDHDYSVVWEEHNTVTKKFYKNTDSAIEWLGGRLVHLQHSVDITAEKEAMNKLEDARLQAELASSAKSDFLSRMSHEIRTPINAIIGMSRIASSSNDLMKMHDCIKKIDSSSKQLLGIINDILDMSKIEANKMEMFLDTFDFEKMLIDISNVIAVKSEEQQQKLHIHMDMSMPRFFRGDEMRLSQVVTNLLSNAVKFTPQFGTVSMDVREKESAAGKSVVEVRVSDTGIGIPTERQGFLFQSFEQADGGIARKFGGTGLGLAISKSIIKMMGGDIWVESAPGQGSTFTFTVPLEIAAVPEELLEPFKGVDLTRIKVLLLDESVETREYFSKIMASFGIEDKTCASVEECFQVLEKAQEKEEFYNIIFVDWNIDPDHGAELCEKIKRQFGSSIIVLTSVSQWNDAGLRVEEYGISAYLSKPFFPSTLFNVINKVAGLPANKADIAQINRYLFAGYHILLAEDVDINREIIYQALEDTKVKISSAATGKAAVEMFAANPGAYDLVLMDVNMPEMDGYEATRAIRSLSNEWAKEAPILAMTANAFSEDVEKSLASGMNDHITKPIKFEVLFDKLHRYLTQNSQNRTGGSASKPPAQNMLKEEGILDTQGLVDVKDGLGRVKGNVKVYKTLLQSFLKHPHFDELQQAFERKDAQSAAQVAHLIKGVSANMSLVEINKNIVALEEKLKDGVFDEALFRSCHASFEKTKEVLNSVLEQL